MSFRIGIAKVWNHSMIPVLVPDDRVLVRYGVPFVIGDVVVFKRADKMEIKRVQRIDDDGVYLVGDNDFMSLDSRSYGLIPPESVIGKAIVRLWPHPGHV